MSERITNSMVTGATLNDLNTSLTALQRTSEEMASGKTILEPSDNPYGASRVIDLQSELDGLSSYTTNVKEGISWANTSSGAMSSMSSAAERVRELLVQASNGTYNQGDRNNIATEVEQLTEQVKQDANTQYAGQYVFSGTASTTAPYKQGEEDKYQGGSGAITRAIGPSSSVVINTEISALLGSGKASGDGKLLDVLRTISEHLRGGTSEDLAALNSSDLKGIDANLETLSNLQASNGSVTDQLQMASTHIEALQGSLTQGLSNTEDADIAKVSIEYSTQQAGYESALRAGASIVQESLLNFL